MPGFQFVLKASGRMDWSTEVPAPQTFGVPPPPHDSPWPQLPQESVALQPSLMVPQFLPWAAQVVGVQVPAPQTLGVPPPPHDCPWPQLPQESVPLQPSLTVPQFLPCGQEVSGVQEGLPPSGDSPFATSTVPEHPRQSRTRIRAMPAPGCSIRSGNTRPTRAPDKVHIGANFAKDGD